jgi:hypothetical protein
MTVVGRRRQTAIDQAAAGGGGGDAAAGGGTYGQLCKVRYRGWRIDENQT